MAKPTNQAALAELEDAIEERANGTPPAEDNPQTGGSPLTIVRAKVSTSVTTPFKALVDSSGVEYGVLLEMAMMGLLAMEKTGLRYLYESVLKERSENTFK